MWNTESNSERWSNIVTDSSVTHCKILNKCLLHLPHTWSKKKKRFHHLVHSWRKSLMCSRFLWYEWGYCLSWSNNCRSLKMNNNLLNRFFMTDILRVWTHISQLNHTEWEGGGKNSNKMWLNCWKNNCGIHFLSRFNYNFFFLNK